jgi:uncharacterized peroxidase-related enzyme
MRPAAWIETIDPSDATGTLKDAYDWQSRRLGEPTEFTQLGSLYPDLVMERLRLYKVSEGARSGLEPLERLFAALVASALNGTIHCGSGLRLRLREAGVADEVIATLDADPTDAGRIAGSAGGGERLAAILAYAARLTRRPGEIVAADVQRLRAAGLGDLVILDLNNLVAYYNYINRVANGLGLHTPIAERLHAVAAMPQ